jgi:hypothetical protein
VLEAVRDHGGIIPRRKNERHFALREQVGGGGVDHLAAQVHVEDCAIELFLFYDQADSIVDRSGRAQYDGSGLLERRAELVADQVLVFHHEYPAVPQGVFRHAVLPIGFAKRGPKWCNAHHPRPAHRTSWH